MKEHAGKKANRKRRERQKMDEESQTDKERDKDRQAAIYESCSSKLFQNNNKKRMMKIFKVFTTGKEIV